MALVYKASTLTDGGEDGFFQDTSKASKMIGSCSNAMRWPPDLQHMLMEALGQV
jgi:hypothetical protein